MKTLPLIPAILVTLSLAACKGDTGPAGAPGLDTGVLSGTVKSATGAALSGASVSTSPATTTVKTDSSGAFSFGNISIGSYVLTATMTGYASAQQSGVGVAAGATTQVSFTLSPAMNAAGSVTGTVYARQGAAQSVALGGATVCVEGAANANLPCATSASDGSFALPNVPPGPVFLSATASGLLDSETRDAVFVSPGTPTGGVAMTLSGSPGSGATYVGAATCVKCHQVFQPGLVTAWQQSAHAMTVDLTLNHVDLNGWPAVPASCAAAPNTKDSTVPAIDPVSGKSIEVWLARWPANCAGTPQFAMFFDTNGNGKIDAGETVMPIQGTQGGVAGDAGNCGEGGILPTANPCSANYLTGGKTAAHGWWQQEYLLSIAPGAGKPAWVTWDTTNTPEDLMVLPLTWNQRTQVWASAPDYYDSVSPGDPRGDTFSKVCTGCHDSAAFITTDANGYVTQYGHIGETAQQPIAQNIACERCHGPGSAHAASSGQSQYIINPAYATAQARNEMCGQCHTNAMASTQPSGAFDFAWNIQATTGGGNFIPGVHQLSDFATWPPYGDPSVFWLGGVFVNLDHMTFVDVVASAHNTNAFERVTCSDCHESHSLAGGPYQMQRTDASNGDQYVFQSNDAALRNDVLCLSCHATHGDFASVQLADAAAYHISTGNGCAPSPTCPAVAKNGSSWTPSAGDQATSVQVVTDAVNAHMLSRAGMPAFFDPTAATQSQPVGRCSSCHMQKTAVTATNFFATDTSGKTANVAGDVTTHIFKVVWPQDTLATLAGSGGDPAATLPNACGTCHVQYLHGP